MEPSLVLDPALLAIPAISFTEIQVAAAIKALTSIAAALRSATDCGFYVHSETPTYLAKAGFFPAQNAIAKMLADFNLSHVYTTEDIRRAVTDVLERAGQLETLSAIDFMIPTTFSASPDVLAPRTGPLCEALKITLLHAAFAAKSQHSSLVQALIADRLVSEQITIVADIDNIDPALEPGGERKIDKCQHSVCCAASVDDFLRDLPAENIWQHAETEAQLALAIRTAAHNARRVSGCQDPKHNCDSFAIGPHFFDSLKRCAASHSGKHSKTTLETCARLVAKMPKNEINRS